ncbi:MAG: hypothetical protein J6T13_05165 [Bacteroidales bacterium]|nr:hypothetical protein [Bacteroidales bacterium]
MHTKNTSRLILAWALMSVCLTAMGQVDETKPAQDTIVIIEEEVTYDTLYLYDARIKPELMSKEDLLETFRRDRGAGRLYYNHGNMYLTGTDGELFKLDNNDLKSLLPADGYSEYCKAKRNSYVSIPLYVAGGCSAAFACVGLYQFCASFIQTATARDQLLESDNLGVDLWRSAMAGVFFFGGGLLATTAFMVPAILLTVKSKVRINRVIDNFNSPATALRLSFGPTPGGAGVTLNF